MENNIRQLIEEADLVLIGIGSEFEKRRFLAEEDALQALNHLASILQKKNYFVVSICINDIAKKSQLQNDRIVQPCGSAAKKQCVNRCEEGLQDLSPEEYEALNSELIEASEMELGKCPKCGASLVLNTVYTESYDENGYLKDWARYTKWLQGTLNKKLCILELGVDLSYPSIIRWPFEKVAFYNNKAHFVRVNEKLYHMSEEIREKGISIPKNAVQWIVDERGGEA